MQFLALRELVARKRASCNLIGHGIGELLDFLRNRLHALFLMSLNLGDFSLQVAMTRRAVISQQVFVFERARPLMVHIHRAIFRGCLTHMAIGAGIAKVGHIRTATAVVRLKLGVLHLNHRRVGARIFPIGEAHAVVVRKNRIRRHLLATRVGIRGHLGLAIEVVLIVALSAHLSVLRNAVSVSSERIEEKLARNGVGFRIVLMAVVAADRLVELADHVVELLGVHAVAFRIHQSGELGRFACNAVCELLFLLRARRFFHALKRIQVAGRLVVAQRERVSLVHGVERRIRFQIVLLARIGRVRRIVHVTRVLVRIDVFPRFGGHHAELVGLGRGMLGSGVW